MASYERYTAASMKDVLGKAEEVLRARLPLEKTRADRHSVTLSGGDGTARIEVHRHGLDTQVVATTDQLRTSRLDVDVQFFMANLPYQPDDVHAVPLSSPGTAPGTADAPRSP
jgi:hypothetical protein